jgi:hypothetical protein
MDTIEKRHAGIVAPHRDRSKAPLGGPAAGGSEGLQFNGGNVIECAYVYPVFVGTKWQDNQTWAALAADLQLFLNDVFTSSYVSTLQQYGFLAGSSPGSHFEGAPSSSTLDDAAVAQIVADLKTQGVIPEDSSPSQPSVTAHVAMLYLDDTVQFNDPNIGGASCVNLYGYHYFNTSLLSAPFYYGLIAPMTDACVGDDPYMSPVPQLDRLTRVTSHELGEMISDPDFPNGWYSPTNDEIGDICETSFGSFQVARPDGTTNTWAVQALYSLYDDEQGNQMCVLSSSAPYVGPADAPARAVAPQVADAVRHLLPLPPTYRQGGKIVRKPSEVHQYARRIMGGFAYQNVHAQIPDLLREMAQVLERGARLGQATTRPRAGHRPIVRKLG